jgi:hypothetical protein
MDKSYLEILAENDREAREGFDENAKDILADHNEYEETVGPIEHHHDEIENQDDFKKFGGSHQAAAGPAVPVARGDNTKSSVLHEKDVKTHVINIDSRFRDDPTQLATDFLYKFQRPMKNIVSARISSIEFPNTYYTFSTVRGNTSFTLSAVNTPGGNRNSSLVNKIITIPDGNYDPMDLVNTLNLLILASFPYCTITTEFNPNTGLLNFSSPNQNFKLDFERGNHLSFVPRSFDRGLGYSLGFRVANVNSTRGRSKQIMRPPPTSNYEGKPSHDNATLRRPLSHHVALVRRVQDHRPPMVENMIRITQIVPMVSDL